MITGEHFAMLQKLVPENSDKLSQQYPALSAKVAHVKYDDMPLVEKIEWFVQALIAQKFPPMCLLCDVLSHYSGEVNEGERIATALSTLVKLATLFVYVDEVREREIIGRDEQLFENIQKLLDDQELKQWIGTMTDQGFTPTKEIKS